MPTQVFWTIPPSGDGRAGERTRWTRGDLHGVGRPAFPSFLTDASAGRYGYYDYLFQVARAAESVGFEGAFIPWDPSGEEPWIVAASFARATRRLVFVPEIEPAFATPVYLAKMSASFQRLSGNRLSWKIDVERAPDERRAHGDPFGEDDWAQRADEYLAAAKGVWTTQPFDFRGRFYDVEAGGLQEALAGRPLPHVYTSGTTETALALGAKHADTHLFDASVGEEAIHLALADLRAAAARHGRKVRAGLRVFLVVRHTEAEAAAAAQELGVTTRTHRIGDFASVAGWIEKWASAGVDTFVLGANPHLEEAYRVGEHLLPRISSRFARVQQAG